MMLSKEYRVKRNALSDCDVCHTEATEKSLSAVTTRNSLSCLSAIAVTAYSEEQYENGTKRMFFSEETSKSGPLMADLLDSIGY